jgi:hypothetical protein
MLVKLSAKVCQAEYKRLGGSMQPSTYPQQRRDELGSLLHHSGTIAMPDNSEVNIAIADTLTLLLQNQHALAAAIEEVALWAKSTGSPTTHNNAITALEILDKNASAIAVGIMKLRQ